MARQIDTNGFWEYEDTLLSREGVFPYLGKQIDQQGRFGLKPNQIYYVYRPRTEVCAEDFINSLQNIPLVNDHTMIGEDFTPAEKKGVEGVMYNVHIDEQTKNTIRGTIKVFTERVKDLIEHKQKRELSLGYVSRYRRENGMYDGKPYDFVQYDLRANHVALVDNARMGSDCRVMDCSVCYDSLEVTSMPEEKKNEQSCADELIEKLKGCSDEDIAKVRDFLATSEKKPEDKPAEDAEKKDGEPKEDKPAEDKKEEKPDESKEDKPAEDAEKKDEPKKEEDKPAEDADKPACACACDESIRKEVAAEYGRAVALANRCKDAGFTISMDGLFTEKEVAAKACSIVGAKYKESPIDAINNFLTGCGKKSEKFVTVDSADKQGSFDFLAAYKGK